MMMRPVSLRTLIRFHFYLTWQECCVALKIFIIFDGKSFPRQNIKLACHVRTTCRFLFILNCKEQKNIISLSQKKSKMLLTNLRSVLRNLVFPLNALLILIDWIFFKWKMTKALSLMMYYYYWFFGNIDWIIECWHYIGFDLISELRYCILIDDGSDLRLVLHWFS